MTQQPANTQQVNQIRVHQILDLIASACNGDLQALEDFFALISVRVDQYCASLIKIYGCYRGGWKDREDLKQDVKIKIWKQLHKAKDCNDDQHVIHWCLRLAKNVFLDERRKAKNDNECSGPPPNFDRHGSTRPCQEDILIDKLADDWLSTLSEEDKEMVELSIDGYSVREISQVISDRHNIKVSHSLVKRHLDKAVMRLRAWFERTNS